MDRNGNTETILSFLQHGLLVRSSWGGEENGRRTACLLSALAPVVADGNGAKACPAEIMPAWLAELTPWIDDFGSQKEWEKTVRRYAELAGRWDVLTIEDWSALEFSIALMILEMILPYAEEATNVVLMAIGLMTKEQAGIKTTIDKWFDLSAENRKLINTTGCNQSLNACWTVRSITTKFINVVFNSSSDGQQTVENMCNTAQEVIAVACSSDSESGYEAAMLQTADLLIAAILDKLEAEITRAEKSV